MSFKLWFEQEQNKEFKISKPYYRLVSNLMHGARAVEKLGDEIAPNTYWTERWDAILFMLRSLFLHTMGSRIREGLVTIYETNNAIMKEAPEEHKWAFNYAHDAGEAVLVKLLEPPKVIYKGKLDSPQIENLIDQSFKHEPPVNHENHGVKAQLSNGQFVFISPDYNKKVLEIVKKEGWRFITIQVIKNIQEWNQFEKIVKSIDWDSDQGVGLMYFFRDMGWE